MAPIRYSLHYEDYSEHLMSRFGKLLQMQSLVDMTLMCSSHTLRVHKAVLAASSAYFQEVLQKQSGEPLIILKMRFSVLKCLVEFMYCGKTQCLEENLDELVSAAQFLKIKGLSKVTKEGLGINNPSELPVFTPPVVINRPPQSLIDLHSQVQDMVVRIPFDIEGGSGIDYADPTRGARPRRGRPSFKRPSGWETGTGLGRAAERALLRREHDSRKAIHHLKHLQTRHMQDYMDRVTLSQAVNSICNNDNSQSYLNMDNDLMYMDQAISSNALDPTAPYNKDSLGNETITSNYPTSVTNTANEASSSDINTAMSQYVNALKNAGLPTDLPILFESGDGSYINVNEQVLLDMVQSSEIQYEVIEQPNIIEKVADPSEIKSIDELSKSIERGEMLMGSKSFASHNDFNKSSNANEINSLNAILPDNLESFGEHQNYVVLDHSLQDSHASISHDNANDFSSIESDMQFFTKTMSDDVKKYYEEQQLNDARVMDQFCPASTSLDASFNMSLLDTKTSHLEENMSQQFNSLNTEDLRRTDDCYDFSLQLPHSNVFKEDTLDCLMSPKQNEKHGNYIEDNLDSGVQERDEIIKDLMNIENKIAMEQSKIINEDNTMNSVLCDDEKENITPNENTNFSSACELKWDVSGKDSENVGSINVDNALDLGTSESQMTESKADLTKPDEIANDKWDAFKYDEEIDKNVEDLTDGTINTTLDENIPFAVGLLPLKQMQPSEDDGLLKRKLSDDMLDNIDAQCLKRKIKYKKV
ncbi:jg16276 [Pararge aegeria aegeria]|uniref:Jg16276 protein n=1 Tax=Pararge aegeria aegeria TaxID=348720 RepID=A0A8S4RWC3_9NEOP|nr:jg16276 [Pararge aegeria aegeria]